MLQPLLFVLLCQFEVSGSMLRTALHHTPFLNPLSHKNVSRDSVWRTSVNHIHRFHIHPRVKSNVPKEGSCTIALKFFVAVRRTSTTLDVLLNSRVGDNWNVDGDWELSGPWTRFTQFTVLIENLQIDTRGLGAT